MPPWAPGRGGGWGWAAWGRGGKGALEETASAAPNPWAWLQVYGYLPPRLPLRFCLEAEEFGRGRTHISLLFPPILRTRRPFFLLLEECGQGDPGGVQVGCSRHAFFSFLSRGGIRFSAGLGWLGQVLSTVSESAWPSLSRPEERIGGKKKWATRQPFPPRIHLRYILSVWSCHWGVAFCGALLFVCCQG